MRHMKKPEKRSRLAISSVVWVILALIIMFFGYKFFYPNHVDDQSSTASQASSAKTIEIEESNSTASKKASSSSKKTKKESIWTDEQDAKLASFVSDWQQTMGQSYQGTNDGKSVSFGGATFPDYFENGKFYVNQQAVSMKWTTKKDDDSDYQVVATYAGAQYLYLFTFHDDTPEVLVTSQSVGDGLNFKVTENAQLVSGFQKIATENQN
jgi:cytoskeletal protein RodZ